MTTILAAAILLAPTFKGEWIAWRITSGSCLVTPPKLATGKLVLNADETFTWRRGDGSTVEDSKGTYRVEGKDATLSGDGTITRTLPASEIDVRTMSFMVKLTWVDGQLWGPSFLFTRPNKKPNLPRLQKDWPHDFLP
jgi:hypothetical protein